MVNRTRVEGGGYSKHDITTWYDQQAGCKYCRRKIMYQVIILHTPSSNQSNRLDYTGLIICGHKL